ncbi:MAG: Smr/MutS family protein [Myxococcales bacterium]|nr:Smr/MutS family protein [Myxococcales bacterium]
MELLLAQKTLESLEWPEVVSRLLRYCRTPQARLRLGVLGQVDAQAAEETDTQRGNSHGHSSEERMREASTGVRLVDGCALAELETSVAGVCERLAETSEARHLLEAGESPPLHGVADLRRGLRRAEMGGILSAQQLFDVLKTLEAVGQVLVYLGARRDSAPLLAGLAESIELDPQLAQKISHCLDPSGEVRDAASPALKHARRQASDLAAQLQRRLGSYLRDSNVQAALSDSYFTVRNDRYVLPVRADARNRVRGIVHDASRSGTTLFIEPEAVVELNNRLKQTELEVAREIERVLRDLSQAVSTARPSLEIGLVALATIDLAFARGHLSIELDAVHPAVERGGCFRLEGLRHPLLPRGEAVPNDIELGERHTVLIISGPNGGGKTVAMKAVGLAAVMIRLGMHVPAAAGARVDLFDNILVDIGDGQDLRESLSTFSAHMVNLSGIVEAASPHTLALLDEVGVGTDPSEGAALAQSILETLAARGARVIATTHYSLLKEMAEVDERFCNACVEFDPITLAPTFRLHTGSAGVSSATAVAARMGMAPEVLDRANALLEREDRQLDQMLSELANSRATLEREKQEAVRLRAESETARSEYQGKLERLQERRDKIYESMRADLDATFKDAHAQVAAVIRGLQRAGDTTPKQAARGAAHARERLLSLEERSQEQPREPLPEERTGPAVDWRRAKPGDSVLLPGGRKGVLKSLPDRRGRVTVQIASAKFDLEAAKVRLPLDAERSNAAAANDGRGKVHFERAEPDSTEVAPGGGSRECDLRGRRVDEALDELARALDLGLRDGDEILRIIHGIGTGALRSAVREHLTVSPHIISHRAGERGEGGEGVTIATLRR